MRWRSHSRTHTHTRRAQPTCVPGLPCAAAVTASSAATASGASSSSTTSAAPPGLRGGREGADEESGRGGRVRGVVDTEPNPTQKRGAAQAPAQVRVGTGGCGCRYRGEGAGVETLEWLRAGRAASLQFPHPAAALLAAASPTSSPPSSGSRPCSRAASCEAALPGHGVGGGRCKL